MKLWAGLLERADVSEALAFYSANEHYDLRAPTAGECRELGKRLFLVGIRVEGKLAAIAWIALKDLFVHTVLSDESLSVASAEQFADSGGWCVRKDLQGGEFLRLLMAAVGKAWFSELHPKEAPPLWGRMMGQKDASGEPLFWSKFGAAITGVSYHDLLKLPFGKMEQEIFERWPREPIPLARIPQGALSARGVTFGPLQSAGLRLSQWGFVDTPLYVPTSLNVFKRVTEYTLRAAVGDVGAFFEDALSRLRLALR